MRLLSQAISRVASRALTTSASRPSVILRRPFSSCGPTIARPKLAISSLVHMRTYATEPDENDPEREVPRNAQNPFQDETAPSNRLYVGNLLFDTIEDTVASEFSKFGTVRTVDMPRMGGPKALRRGIAYIEFETTAQATAALAMNDQVLEGRMLTVQYARAQRISRRFVPKSDPTRTLYIGNIPHEMNDMDLNELFRDIPGVMDVRVAIDRRTGKARGFAHADFTTVELAEQASEKISSLMFHGRKLRTDFSENTPEKYREHLTRRRQGGELTEGEEDPREGQSRDA